MRNLEFCKAWSLIKSHFLNLGNRRGTKHNNTSFLRKFFEKRFAEEVFLSLGKKGGILWVSNAKNSPFSNCNPEFNDKMSFLDLFSTFPESLTKSGGIFLDFAF
mmetsp:Transcript_23356/g.34961  ORF Transcript_23356/g.34961 Transcript_23356/m.34961 type:complete len:104 (-) Transcript_23356:2063-2374(-)